MISGLEAEKRLRRVSELRDLVLKLRGVAWESYRAGTLPTEPAYDIRSDYDYWKKLAEEKGIKIRE